MQPFVRRAALARWVLLLASSLGAAALLDFAGLASAWLLGAMIAGVACAVQSAEMALPPLAFTAAQALVGCLIASAVDMRIAGTLLADWPMFLGITFATLVASGLLGYALGRLRVVPYTVAIWGSTPGAATAMVIMAQAYGADVRLVAVMVYTRVVSVAAVASLLTLAASGHAAAHRSMWSGLLAVDAGQLALTLAVAGVGGLAGRRARLPAGALIGPMALGIALDLTGIARVAPPRALLALAYLAVGWRVGLSFTRQMVAAAARALPQLLLAALLLIAFCGGLALLLEARLGIDPVTAYLATSPGGMDSVAIIAASGHADMAIVMALQLTRFVVVMLVGPALATALARRQRAAAAA